MRGHDDRARRKRPDVVGQGVVRADLPQLPAPRDEMEAERAQALDDAPPFGEGLFSYNNCNKNRIPKISQATAEASSICT